MIDSIESWERGFYVVPVKDKAIKAKLAGWKDVGHLATHYGKGWEYVFPARLYDRVAKLTGFPLKKKNANRVLAGKRSKVSTGEKRHVFTKVNPQESAFPDTKTEQIGVSYSAPEKTS